MQTFESMSNLVFRFVEHVLYIGQALTCHWRYNSKSESATFTDSQPSRGDRHGDVSLQYNAPKGKFCLGV